MRILMLHGCDIASLLRLHCFFLRRHRCRERYDRGQSGSFVTRSKNSTKKLHILHKCGYYGNLDPTHKLYKCDTAPHRAKQRANALQDFYATSIFTKKLHILHKRGYHGNLDPTQMRHCPSIKATLLSIRRPRCRKNGKRGISVSTYCIRQMVRFLKGRYEMCSLSLLCAYGFSFKRISQPHITSQTFQLLADHMSMIVIH
jgi:hypothetical protein